MASKNTAQRRAQFCELVERLGAKLGGRGFSLNEEFHHVVWLGDLNFHVAGVTAADALAAVKAGRHMELLLHHDELLMEKARGAAPKGSESALRITRLLSPALQEAASCFYEYEEPLMAPDFYPSYKKLAHRVSQGGGGGGGSRSGESCQTCPLSPAIARARRTTATPTGRSACT